MERERKRKRRLSRPRPAGAARRGPALLAVISLATRSSRGDNGPPNGRSRETGAVTPTNGRRLSLATPQASCRVYLFPTVLCSRTPPSLVFFRNYLVRDPVFPVCPSVCQPPLFPPRPEASQTPPHSVRLQLTSFELDSSTWPGFCEAYVSGEYDRAFSDQRK